MNPLLEKILSRVSYLTESVAVSSVTDAIKGRYQITINYVGDPAHGIAPGIRTIQVYVYGLTKAGNPCIRAYQPYGDTASEVPNWKLFRLDRITAWKPTYALFNKPAPLFNPNGDRSMSVVYDIVKFNNPTNTNRVDGPKPQQQFKQVGQLSNIEKILADREKEKQNKLQGQKQVSRPVFKPKPIPNKAIPEPMVSEPEEVESEPIKTEVPEPEIQNYPDLNEPEKEEVADDNAIKTAGDEELEKFKAFNKRLDNAPIMDLSNRRFR